MTIEDFIHSMPKVELNVRLDGAMRKETLLMIAEQNDKPKSIKDFDLWAGLLDNHDFARLDEIASNVCDWLQYPDDLSRIVYDLGVHLAKQNVKYAEVSVNPILYMLPGMSLDVFLSALNDGRDRAERGWGIRLSWVLSVPRNEPRRADEILRWAASVTGVQGNVVAFGLEDSKSPQPIAQFERVFNLAHKKDCPRSVQVGGIGEGVEDFLEAFQHLDPSRIIDAWGVADAPDALQILDEQGTPLVVSMGRALCHGWIKQYGEYPLRRLYDENAKLVVSADMPSFYNNSLTAEYLAVVEHCEFSLEELEELALNAVQASYLPDDDKSTMLKDFQEMYTQLRSEHIDADAV